MSEQLPPMPDDLRALLDAATPPAPSPAFEARVLAKINATLSVLPAGGDGSGSSGSGSGSSASSGAGGSAGASGAVASTAGSIVVQKSALVIGGLLLLGAGAAGGVLLGRTVLAPELPPAPPTVVVKNEPKPPEPVGVNDTPPPKPDEPKAVRPPPVKPSEPPKKNDASRDTELSAERALLEVARTALAKGDVTATLEAVERHEREFPKGRLVEEREVLFIQALVQAGKRDEAAKRGGEFKKRFPDSLMLPAVDAVLAP